MIHMMPKGKNFMKFSIMLPPGIKLFFGGSYSTPKEKFLK